MQSVSECSIDVSGQFQGASSDPTESGHLGRYCSVIPLGNVNPCRCECRCFYYPSDAEIESRHGAYQGIRLPQSMSPPATTALHITAQQRSLKEHGHWNSIVPSFAFHNFK